MATERVQNGETPETSPDRRQIQHHREVRWRVLPRFAARGQDRRHGAHATNAFRLSVPGRIQVTYLRAANRKGNSFMASDARVSRLCVR